MILTLSNWNTEVQNLARMLCFFNALPGGPVATFGFPYG